MKKIIMLNSMSFLPHQGRFIRIYNEARTLVDNGYDVTLIVWDRKAEEPKSDERDGIKIERIWVKAGVEMGPLRNGINVLLFNIRAFWKILRKKCDIVHCFNLDTIPAGFLAAKLKRKPSVLDLCEPNYYAFWKGPLAPFVKVINWFEMTIASSFDYVFIHNLYQLKKFRDYGITRLAQIGTFPNSAAIVEQVRPRKGAKKGDVVLGRIGTIYSDNGIEETIEPFEAVSKENKNVRLVFAGRVYENYSATFDSLIKPLGERVETLGSFTPEDMPGLYARIDISLILNRSASEWFRHITPTKLFDSLANGVPVIGSDIGDMRAILETHNCGIIVDETNPEEVAAAIKKLSDDAGLRKAMGNNGLKVIKEEYNWDKMAERMTAIYSEF